MQSTLLIISHPEEMRFAHCIVLFCLGGTFASQECSSTSTSNFKFSLVSERNEKGQWNAQAELQHENNKKLKVNVDQKTINCDGRESIIITANITACPEKTCKVPSDYQLLDGLGYYKFHPEPKTWFDALDTCVKECAHLVVINSQKEADALVNLWKPYPSLVSGWMNDWAHIGFNDLKTKGQYVTIFNQPLNSTGYEKWEPGDPNAPDIEFCGAASRSASTLADIECDLKLAFICEADRPSCEVILPSHN
ncbi:hemolymph lipopolysaccharide-binding protein-like isoform X1 [Periplaneta americana]|uniref:hemolymph lipopolysaccharide-binding protein-like isoform X1 n=2 Tax=Periplaneta americana TaxID=6978 RepID=UPI0037E8589D